MSCEMRSMITSYFLGSSIRMPPIFTNSAVTPAVFIELIFSTKAGGNVSSIPKRIPIFLFAIISVLNLAPLEILSRHPLPQWPIMLTVVPLDIQPMRNPPGMQNLSALIASLDRQVEAEPDLDKRASLLRDALAQHPGESHFERALSLVQDKLEKMNSIVARAHLHEEQGAFSDA